MALETLDTTPLSPPYQTLSLSASPQQFPILDLDDYQQIPDDDTVVQHHPFNLPSLGIVINRRLCSIICLHCHRAINASNLIEHVHKDLPLVEIPEGLPSILETAYNLVPYSSILNQPGPILPIFGLALETNPLFSAIVARGIIPMRPSALIRPEAIEYVY